MTSYLERRPRLKKWDTAIWILFIAYILFSQGLCVRRYKYSFTDYSGSSYVILDKLYLMMTTSKLEMVKFDSSGNRQWLKTHDFEHPNPSYMLVDQNDNLYLALAVPQDSNAVLQDKNTVPQGNNMDSCVIKFDSKGNLLWKRNTHLYVRYLRIADDRLSAIGFNDKKQLATEYFNRSRGLPMHTQSYRDWIGSSNDLFCVDSSGNFFTFVENRSILNKMTSDGNHLWDQEINPYIHCSDLIVDELDHVYLGGYLRTSKDPINDFSSPTAYIVRTTSAGQNTWSKTIEFDDKIDRVNNVTKMVVNKDGCLYAIGEHKSLIQDSESERTPNSWLFLLMLMPDGQTERQILTDLSYEGDFYLDCSGNIVQVKALSWRDTLIVSKYDNTGERQWMAITLSGDRLRFFPLFLVGIVDWFAKQRKKGRVNPFTGVWENPT